MQHYLQHDLKLKRFVPIIQQSLVYPVVLDANRTVLSLPPIINSAHSQVRHRRIFVSRSNIAALAYPMHRLTQLTALQITLDTRDIFIECTATDLAKANIVLATLCTMFSQYCTTPFEVEPVEVIDAFGVSKGEPGLHGLTALPFRRLGTAMEGIVGIGGQQWA